MPSLDLLVIGSGIAGLSAVVRASAYSQFSVGLITKGYLSDSATQWAQGGMAAVLKATTNEISGDSHELHMTDTLTAGAGLCDEDAVRVLVEEGPARLQELIELGAVFDRGPDGELQLSREGGHSTARVVHAGGAATGAEVERALVASVSKTAAAIFEKCFAFDLLIEHERCVGARVVAEDGEVKDVRAEHVLLASGGAGQMYSVTTNPLQATADGLSMALKAGAALADMEFMQFHPTALHHPAMPRTLLSEALRGHGAVLRDQGGQRFVDELAPRDLVSRAIALRLQEQELDHVWLDATTIPDIKKQFPSIVESVRRLGLDPTSDWLPVAPAAHYLCGGVVTDLEGATTIPGLWAAGEVACTGVHGANRLASNSLVEGMTFAPRAVEAMQRGVSGPSLTGAMRSTSSPKQPLSGYRCYTPLAKASIEKGPKPAELRKELQNAMTKGAGVLRTAETLKLTSKIVKGIGSQLELDDTIMASQATSISEIELRNLVTGADALLAAATERRETRGAHSRHDFPSVSEDLAFRLVIR